MVESIGSPITNRLLEDVKITRALIVNWKSYAQSQMITEDDFNFINELDSAEDKQALFLIPKRQILNLFSEFSLV